MHARPTTLARPLAILALALALLTALAAAGPARAGAAADPLARAVAATLVVRSADAEARFLGSAFVWGDGGLALTNAHVVGDAAQVRLVHADGREEVADVLVRDQGRDIAVIALGPGAGPGLHAGAAPRLGQTVYAVGAPLEAEFTLTRGMVSALARQVEAAVPLRLIQHDAAVNPGSSGGPLVDEAGALVGMNSQIADGSRLFAGIGYAISAADLERLVPALLAGDLAAVPQLGLRLRPLSRGIAAVLGVEPGGLLVDHVAAGGLGARAGLRAGDVILAAGGAPIRAPGDLAFAVDAALEAGSVALAVRREAGALTLWLPLDPAPPMLAAAARGVPAARVEGYTLARLGIEIDATGLVVALSENSPARLAGLSVGDRVIAADGVALADAEALRARSLTGPVLLLVRRADGSTQHVLLDPWDRGGRFRPAGGANVLDPDVVVF
jgi:serine protease Do